jgi:hypothetical protein
MSVLPAYLASTMSPYEKRVLGEMVLLAGNAAVGPTPCIRAAASLTWPHTYVNAAAALLVTNPGFHFDVISEVADDVKTLFAGVLASAQLPAADPSFSSIALEPHGRWLIRGSSTPNTTFGNIVLYHATSPETYCLSFWKNSAVVLCNGNIGYPWSDDMAFKQIDVPLKKPASQCENQ